MARLWSEYQSILTRIYYYHQLFIFFSTVKQQNSPLVFFRSFCASVNPATGFSDGFWNCHRKFFRAQISWPRFKFRRVNWPLDVLLNFSLLLFRNLFVQFWCGQCDLDIFRPHAYLLKSNIFSLSPFCLINSVYPHKYTYTLVFSLFVIVLKLFHTRCRWYTNTVANEAVNLNSRPNHLIYFDHPFSQFEIPILSNSPRISHTLIMILSFKYNID